MRLNGARHGITMGFGDRSVLYRLITALLSLLLVVPAVVALLGAGPAAAATVPGWYQASPATSPPGRDNYAMAYDPASSQLILFGGDDNGSDLNDTWDWDGTTWTQLSPATSPSARDSASMAYDPATSQLILFGGEYAGNDLGDTWAWDGTTWTLLSPSTSPLARQGASMAYDPASSQLILFGGASGVGTNNQWNDTWAWSGTTWAQIHPATSPPGRQWAAMAYYPSTSELILFGGFGNSNSLDDTWSWDGTTWIQLSPATSPSFGTSDPLAYDSSIGQMILLDGFQGETSWGWDGTTWTQLFPSTSPPSSFDDPIAYDADTSQLVQFSGSYDETWVLGLGVIAVSPEAGTPAGGTSVTITGNNFTGASAVDFGSAAASSFNVNSNTSITALSPAGSAGTVDVTVTTPVGTSQTSSADQFSYEGSPTVTAVDPAAGTTAGGGSVAITGSNLAGASAVSFGSSPAPTYTVNSATSITATTPAESAGIVDVTVATPLGTSPTNSADQFTFEGAPVVTTVAPVAGSPGGGSSVTISGSNFTGASAVSFGSGLAPTYTVSSATSITAVSPAESPGTVDVTVTTPVGASTTSPADLFIFEDTPSVAGISPAAATNAGGTPVTITGSNFNAASAVSFGSILASTYTVNSATSITAVSPAGWSAGTVDVTVSTPVGTSTVSSADRFDFEPTPSVTAVSPAAGVTAGGNSVTITGTNFSGASAVTFGTTAATGYSVNSANSISAASPAESVGTVDITVTTAGGTSPTATDDHFTYEGNPSVSALSLPAGTTAGGTSVIITGTSFAGASAVTFGTTAASGYTVNSATSITAVSPAESAGNVDITVTTPVGTSTASPADQFTYGGAPTVTALSPSAGTTAGGTPVGVTGTGFTGVSAVTFASIAASSFTVNSATSITAASPPGAGTVDVTVTTPGGTSTISPADQFTYEDTPRVTAVNPVAGGTAAGTPVTITGTDFTGASAVTFGSTATSSFTVNSVTSISASSPLGTGTVDVTVTTPGGISTTSPADQFTYETAPSVTAVNPLAGGAAAGSLVAITGTDFTGASAVTFGSTATSSFIVISATSISATPPLGVGTVDVTVTTPMGTSSTSPVDQFTYETAPSVTGLSPTAGTNDGGAIVNLTGTNFTATSAVTFGSTAATVFVVRSVSFIVVASPPGSGTVDVTVTTPSGTSTISSDDQFTYEDVPSVTAVNPPVGTTSGGTGITITGTNFTGATAVTFGSTDAEFYFVNSPTSITAIDPAGFTGAVNITVTTPVDNSVTSSADQFTYEGVPSVTALSPTAGTSAGGSSVTITGANFTGATAVNFGSVPATSFTVDSTTSLTAIDPAELPGTVDITVTTPNGISSDSSADQFGYQNASGGGGSTPGPLTPAATVPTGSGPSAFVPSASAVISISTSGHKVFGGLVTYLAKVTVDAEPVEKGKVTFSISKRSICSAVVARGLASCSSRSAPGVGVMALVARYGQSSQGTATAKALLSISPDASELLVTTKAVGTKILLSFKVSAAPPGSGTPRGWIAVRAGKALYDVGIIDSKASLLISDQISRVTIELHSGPDFLGLTEVHPT